MTKLTTGASTRGERQHGLRDDPIHASGAAVEGPRPSGAGSPICHPGRMPDPGRIVSVALGLGVLAARAVIRAGHAVAAADRAAKARRDREPGSCPYGF